MTPREATERQPRDAGITLVIVAIMVTTLVVVAALAIDGGQAYANRRQMQNAADVAAIAGTRYYAQNRYLSAPPATVGGLVGEIRDAASANRSDLTLDQLDCWLVDASLDPRRLPVGGPIDICDDPSAAWSTFAGAAGVEVRSAREQRTYFGVLAGLPVLNARASATATMQPLVAYQGGVPFIVCGMPETDGSGNDILDYVDGQYRIKDSALNQWYALQAGDGGGRDPVLAECGAGSAFDGTGDDEPPTIGEWIDGGNGNPFDREILADVINSPDCATDQGRTANGCLLVLPIASDGRGNGRNGVELYVVTFGIFKVWGNGTGATPPECRDNFGSPAPKYCGQLIGRGEVTGGNGGTGEVVPNSAYVIKLVR